MKSDPGKAEPTGVNNIVVFPTKHRVRFPPAEASAVASALLNAPRLTAMDCMVNILKDARKTAYDDENAARSRFNDLCPSPPPEIVILDRSHPGSDRYGTTGQVSAWSLRKDLPGCDPRSRVGRWMRKALPLAEAWEAIRDRALSDSGLNKIRERIETLDRGIECTVQKAFEFTPETAAECGAQARAFLLAHEWARDRNAISMAYGPLLAESAATLSDGGA